MQASDLPEAPECYSVETNWAPLDGGPEPEWIEFAGDPAPRMHRIRRDGSATVTLAGREFSIGSAFLDDIRRQDPRRQISSLQRPLLVFHSPLDRVPRGIVRRRLASPGDPARRSVDG